MKKILSFLLAAVLAGILIVPAAARSFPDVPAASSLKAEIEQAAEYGLIQGYSNGKFGYAESMTRAQFVTVLSRMMGWLSDAQSTNSCVTDAMQVSASTVSASYWASINCAARHDVVDTNVAFRPNDAITRAEIAQMLVRAMGLKSAAAVAEKGSSLPFTDVTSGKGYISVAYATGMTNGMTTTIFAPNNHATRGQAAAMLVRIYQKLRQDITWNQAFYAISSYQQLGLVKELNLNAVSAGWSRMTWDGTTALLSTTSANANEYYIPGGYSSVVNTLEEQGTALNLSVYMDTSGGLKELLSSASGRTQAVDQIIHELTVSYKALGTNPYAGVTIDFEGLRSAQKANFTDFLTELSGQLKAAGKTLYVCVSPTLTTGVYYDGYDYRAIGAVADKVILMAYDYDARDLSAYVGTEYYKTTAPVPMDQVYASLLAITDKTTGVEDRNKIVLGFNTKCVAWQIDSNGKLLSATPVYPDLDTVSRRLAQADTEKGWSNTYQCSYAVYTTENGGRYFLWYQDEAACKAELDVANLLGIHGVSIWRLGTVPGYWTF